MKTINIDVETIHEIVDYLNRFALETEEKDTFTRVTALVDILIQEAGAVEKEEDEGTEVTADYSEVYDSYVEAQTEYLVNDLDYETAREIIEGKYPYKVSQKEMCEWYSDTHFNPDFNKSITIRKNGRIIFKLEGNIK
jgi:hypothetical protein